MDIRFQVLLGRFVFFVFAFFQCVSGCRNIDPRDFISHAAVGLVEKSIPDLLNGQIKDSMDNYYGAIPDSYGIHHPSSCAGFIQNLASVYSQPSSTYFHSAALLHAMTLASIYLLKSQHDDGTIDLLTTNFHSTPDLAFAVEPLALAYKILTLDSIPEEEILLENIKTFLVNGGQALSVGGIHTPNHRWVVSMALARINNLFPDTKYISRINEWLDEGIDIDADGQYNEKSTYIYSPLTNRALITVARLTENKQLYESVRKNLGLTPFLIHPNGTLVTETSRRQDQFLSRPSDIYYYAYRYMAVHDQDENFGAMANYLEKNYGSSLNASLLPYALEDSSLWNPYPIGSKMDKYDTLFKQGGIARWRDENMDASLISNNSTLFTFSNANAMLQAVRLSSAFFGKGQFKADSLFRIENGYQLVQSLQAPYYQPYSKNEVDPGGDWDKMARENRKQSEIQKLHYSIKAHLIDNAWLLEFDVQGTAGVPVAVELSFKKGGQLLNVIKLNDNSDIYILKSKFATYKYHQSEIEFGPGTNAHTWTQIRGAEPKIEGMSVYFTGYTPFNHTLTIRGR
ncbi:MAG: hypothetical protein ABI844_04325 [Saprospiraceae bacterium]